jgi:hypothetical protein
MCQSETWLRVSIMCNGSVFSSSPVRSQVLHDPRSGQTKMVIKSVSTDSEPRFTLTHYTDSEPRFTLTHYTDSEPRFTLTHYTDSEPRFTLKHYTQVLHDPRSGQTKMVIKSVSTASPLNMQFEQRLYGWLRASIMCQSETWLRVSIMFQSETWLRDSIMCQSETWSRYHYTLYWLWATFHSDTLYWLWAKFHSDTLYWLCAV